MPLITDRFAVVVPTYNGGELFAHCIDSIRSQNVIAAKLICIDSSSSDQSATIARNAGFDVRIIQKSDFNHGGTRNLGVEICGDVDIVVFLTQDAILLPDALQNMLKYFSNPMVGSICGRQIPHLDATPLAVHARAYNYGQCSTLKSMADVEKYGIKSVFMSNSFSAYRTSALRDVGGFPSNTILCEDMYVAAKMLKMGYLVGYGADAVVKHSHNYSAMEEFRRYFDIGVFHSMEPWIQREFGTAGKEGFKYLMSEFSYLYQHHKIWLCIFLINNFAKYSGVKLGAKHLYLPYWLKLKCTMHKAFWLKNR